MCRASTYDGYCYFKVLALGCFDLQYFKSLSSEACFQINRLPNLLVESLVGSQALTLMSVALFATWLSN